MKILSLINQNIPIWSVLKGDHACSDLKQHLSESLIKNPNFLSRKENELRKTYLRETNGRRWLYDLLDGKSFAVVKIERKDLESALTVWKHDIPLMEVAQEYKKAFEAQTGFSYKDVIKTEQNVLDVSRRKQQLVPVHGLDWLTQLDERLDCHRAIWMKRRKDNKMQVVDGTHRTLALTWHYLLDKQFMPKHWYAIMFEE